MPKKRKMSHLLVKRVMNKIIREYEPLVNDWISNPIEKPFTLETKHRFLTYRIPIKLVAEYLMIPEFDRKPFGCPDEYEYKKGKIKFCTLTYDYSDLEKRLQEKYEKYDKYRDLLDLISKQIFWYS